MVGSGWLSSDRVRHNCFASSYCLWPKILGDHATDKLLLLEWLFAGVDGVIGAVLVEGVVDTVLVGGVVGATIVGGVVGGVMGL